MLFSVNVDIAKYTQGWGTLENAAEGDFFNGLITTNDDDIKLTPYSNGTSDLSTFGKNDDIQLTATEKVVSCTTLLDYAADRTRPHIIPLDDGKKMLTFIDDSRDRAEYNGATLYYSIFDGTHWSIPKAVADDGTPDSIHTLKKIGDKVIIAWTDVKDAFAGVETSREKLSSIGISCAIYDTQTNNCVPAYIHLFEINEFSYIKLSETLGFPYIHTHYIFLKRTEENKTNNHKKRVDFIVQ